MDEDEPKKTPKASITRRVKIDEDGYIGSPKPFLGGGIVGTPYDPSPSAVAGAKVKRLTTISVYVDNGNVYEYEVNSEAKAREHAAAIIATGYRSVSADNPTLLTWFPPSRIVKVVANLPATSTTKYFDRIKST
jgi:hypothetical protein